MSSLLGIFFCGIDHPIHGLCGSQWYAYNGGMETREYRKGRTVKTVVVTDALGCTDDEVVRFALARAGEKRENLFGTRVFWQSLMTAVVDLYTD